MSESMTKKERQAQARAALSQKEKQEQEKARKSRRNAIIYTVVGIVVAIAVAALLVWDSGVIQTHMTALSVGNRKYTILDLNYYYYSSYSTYSASADTYGLDTSVPLDQQEVSEGYTWDQMLKDSAVELLTDVSVLYQEAMADGYELSQDGQDQVAITLNNTSSYASLFGVTEKYYLESNYGRYMTMSELERILTEYQIAQEYAQHKGTSFEVSDDEIQAFYNENSAELDTIDYNCYLVGYDRTETDADGNTVDLDEATIEANRAQAQERAQEILDALVAGDQELAAQLAEEYGATDNSNSSGISYSGYADWMADNSHQTGSYGLVENISATDDSTVLGYFAIYINDRHLDEYTGVDVRYIRTTATADDEGNYDMESLTTELDTIIQSYEEGDKTAESFGDLADNYSFDASTYPGGLRENVSKEAFNDEITAWLFDDSRQEGDYQSFVDEDNHTCYLFYFIGHQDTPYWRTVCYDNVQEEKYYEWLDEVTPNYPTQNGFAMRFVG